MPYKQLLKAVALAALASTAHVSHAAVLNFDDLIGTGPQGPAFDYFKADYNGFRFGNNSTMTNTWFHTDETDLPLPLPEYTPVSGNRYASTCFPDPTNCAFHSGSVDEPTLPITSAVAFIFNGAYFSGFDSIRYDLYVGGIGGALVHSSAPSADLGGTGVPLFVASGYNGLVDTVVVRGSQGFFAMDDFTYNVTAVPEPGSLALVSLAGLLIVASRRNAKSAAK